MLNLVPDTEAEVLEKIVSMCAAFHAGIAGGMTAADWRGLELWLDQDERHRQVFELMYQMSCEISGADLEMNTDQPAD